MDPFVGSGTTAVAAKKLRRRFIGIDINKEYVEIASQRLEKVVVQKAQLNKNKKIGVQCSLFENEKKLIEISIDGTF